MTSRLRDRSTAFTLIELLVVLAIGASYVPRSAAHHGYTNQLLALR
jgi:prepilin-type N-terminal cleavage/methylation domain-containing protein